MPCPFLSKNFLILQLKFSLRSSFKSLKVFAGCLRFENDFLRPSWEWKSVREEKSFSSSKHETCVGIFFPALFLLLEAKVWNGEKKNLLSYKKKKMEKLGSFFLLFLMRTFLAFFPFSPLSWQETFLSFLSCEKNRVKICDKLTMWKKISFSPSMFSFLFLFSCAWKSHTQKIINRKKSVFAEEAHAMLNGLNDIVERSEVLLW